MSMRYLLILLAATGCVVPQPPVSATAPVAPEPEFVIYERDMALPNVPVVFPSESDVPSALRKLEYEQYGIPPIEHYRHIIRYAVSWQQGQFESENMPRINQYIIQVALAGDATRAQVLLLERVTPVPAGRSPVRRSVGWITPAAFSELREKVLRDAAALPGPESALTGSMIRRSHSTQTRLGLHSHGPAQIYLRREGHSDRPASVYRAGEHLIAEAERALGRPIRRP